MTQHLSRGTVEKLEVINHKWVKVYDFDETINKVG